MRVVERERVVPHTSRDSSSSTMVPMGADVPLLVAQMNDVAVGYLQKSRSEDACRLLIEALDVLETSQRLRATIQPDEVRSNAAEPFGSSSLATEETHAVMSSSVQHHLPRYLSTGLPERSHQANLPTGIYNRAFRIRGSSVAMGRSVHLDVAVLSFNVALSYHIMGDNSQCLHRALLWYNQCSQHILLEERRAIWGYPPIGQDLENNRVAAPGGGGCRTLIVLLAAALCHNLAAIHGDHLFDIQRARSLRCQLAHVLQWEGRTLSVLETDDFVFFHLGILFALLDDFQVAPAA